MTWHWIRSVVSDSLWPQGCSLPGSSVHGIFQARVLEWVAISFSRRSSWPRDRTRVSHIDTLPSEPPGKSKMQIERHKTQDGGVEGHAFLMRTPKPWTKLWNLPKRYLHPKTRKKSRWDGRRGAIIIKSNPISAGWVTHKLQNSYTAEVFLLVWKFWALC